MKTLIVTVLVFFAYATSAPAMTLMPLGDSITYGALPDGKGGYDTGSSGYRSQLYQLLRESGADVDFVGSMKSGNLPDRDHEGHPGWTTETLKQHIEVLTRQNPADIVLLHIGTNDIASSSAGSNAEISAANNVIDIVDRILLLNPKSVVMVAQIINFRSLHNRISRFNFLLRSMIENRYPNSKSVCIVNMEDVLDYRIDMIDEAHPNSFGYKRMADEWFNAIKQLKRDAPN